MYYGSRRAAQKARQVAQAVQKAGQVAQAVQKAGQVAQAAQKEVHRVKRDEECKEECKEEYNSISKTQNLATHREQKVGEQSMRYELTDFDLLDSHGLNICRFSSIDPWSHCLGEKERDNTEFTTELEIVLKELHKRELFEQLLSRLSLGYL
jgi:hypothetical protein